MLNDSAKAVRDAVKSGVETGREMNLHYDHPILLLQHTIWHEGWGDECQEVRALWVDNAVQIERWRWHSSLTQHHVSLPAMMGLEEAPVAVSHFVNGARPVPRPISLPLPIAITLAMIWGFGPALAAIVVTAIESGRLGVRDLWRQFRRWRVHPIWFATASSDLRCSVSSPWC
jgi:hypothetical protein